jgi:hypothetical protein
MIILSTNTLKIAKLRRRDQGDKCQKQDYPSAYNLWKLFRVLREEDDVRRGRRRTTL